MRLACTHPRGIPLCWSGWFCRTRVMILAIWLWCKWEDIKDLSLLWCNFMIPCAELLWYYQNRLLKINFTITILATFAFSSYLGKVCSAAIHHWCVAEGLAEEQCEVSPHVWKLILLRSAKCLFFSLSNSSQYHPPGSSVAFCVLISTCCFSNHYCFDSTS